MKVVCQHCRQLLKVIPDGKDVESHGDCSSYPNVKQCEASKKWVKEWKDYVNEKNLDNSEVCSNDDSALRIVNNSI